MTTVIAHATDLSGADGAAFVHACGLAVAGAARLVSVHGNPASGDVHLPDAAALVARWRAERDESLAISHERRCHEHSEDITETLLDALAQIAPTLLVTGAASRHGLSALLHTSVSQALARNVRVPTLVVPNGCTGFVDAANGRVGLARVLVPAADEATARAGLAAARQLVALGGGAAAELLLLHVGAHAPALPADVLVGVRSVTVPGRLEDVIAKTARQEAACVIVMPTHGHDGLADVLLGSHTEHVLRDATCPVLVVPMTAEAR